MATVTTPLAERAERVFRDLGYTVTTEGSQLRAERKWRSVRVTPVEEATEVPAPDDYHCFVTWAEEATEIGLEMMTDEAANWIYRAQEEGLSIPDIAQGLNDDVFEGLMSEAGITADDTLVAYDDTHGVFAARFLVTALAYGHEDVHLLDGDFSAWSRDHEVERGTPDVEETTYVAREPTSTPFVDYDTVREFIDTAGESDAILDTREPWEWEESHLPGAVQLDWRELVDDDSRGLKSDEEVRAVLADHGVTERTRVLLYCNTARRISHTYVALRKLGYDDVMFYEGSLTEWEAKGAPLESA
jgi:thiosulfate/3-mercaptopyruvate sulfurtransferase